VRGGGIGIFAVCSLSDLLGFLDLLVFDLLVLSVVVGGGVCGEGGPAVGWRSRVHGRGSAACCLFFPLHFIPRMDLCFLLGVSTMREMGSGW